MTTDSGLNKITNYQMMFWFQLQCLIANHISVFNSNSVNKKISQNRCNSFSFFLQIYDIKVRALNITTFNKYFSVDKIVGQMKIFKKVKVMEGKFSFCFGPIWASWLMTRSLGVRNILLLAPHPRVEFSVVITTRI